MTERRRVATQIDIELRVACRMEATARRQLGDAARGLLRRRAYRRLGFVRLSDYARERLGISARTVQEAAWVATRLDALPAVSTAFDRSDISWTHARALCAVASPDNQDHWLALARQSSVEDLKRLVKTARPPRDVPADPDDDADQLDGEPALRLRFACPARLRALWRRALELASRAAGEPLSDWRAAEIIAAEGFSGRPAGASLGERALLESIRRAARERRSMVTDQPAAVDAAVISGEPAAVDAGVISAEATAADAAVTCPTLVPPAHADPFALDARLVAAMRAIRTDEPRIGHLLRIVVGHRFYRLWGFPSVDAYVREHLGISTRKAWALLKLEKATRRSDAFASAYYNGSLPWARALALLPVVDHENAAAWVGRAETVTVRRLCDEVSWVLQARDTVGPDMSLDPPPLDSRLTFPVDPSPAPRPLTMLSPGLQIGAHGERAAELCDVEIQFRAPASVVALFRDVLDAFASPGAPRWAALEGLLRHVIEYWEATPRHRDPIFAREGWRCAVPACSSRRNLNDHHIQFRSRGGSNARWNRIAICAAHHLHGIHDATIRATGTAPDDVEWQLGVRSQAPPLLTCIGDRIRDAPT